MNLATWSIRNPIPVTLFFLLLTLAGLWGFHKLGVQDFPDLDFPAINVVLTQPGAAPAQLETEVARKVEDKIAAVRNLRYLNTTVSEGEVSISAQFEIGTPLSDALLDVKDAVDSVRGDLPEALEEPQVTKVTVGPGGPTLTYAVTHPAMSEEALSWFSDDTIAKAVLGVPGVGRFTRVGGVQREIQVIVNANQLQALGLAVSDVSRTLRLVQADNSGGRSQLGGLEQGIRTLATVRTAEDLANLAIPLGQGRSVKLGDIARVQDVVAERQQAALLDGMPAIGLQISRSKGVDEIELERGVQTALTTLEQQHPGLSFVRVSSTVDHTREQYRGSMTMLYEGALLAVLVIWWFLRDWRATVIGAMALPLSILPTFAFMAWAGYTLNTITLLALAVVVGVLVDDAIVEVENIARHASKGKPIRQATEDAVNEIWMAVLATTAALVVVFLPTAYMSGTAGLVFKQFGWTTVVSVLASLVVARVATPVMAAWLLKDHRHEATGDGWLMTRYLRLARWCLGHRLATLATATLLFALSLGLIPLLPTGFIPASDKGTSAVNIELPPGASIAQTLQAAEEARLAIASVPGVHRVFVTAGSEPAGGRTRASDVGEVRKATLNLVLGPRDERAPQQALENAMRPLLDQVPGIRWSISGGGPGEKVQIILASDDALALKAGADSIETELRALPFLSGVTSTASLERPEVTVRPDASRAAAMGVTTDAIGETLRVATAGDFSPNLAKLNLDQRQVNISVRLDDSVRTDTDALAGLMVPGDRGLVRLDSIAQIDIASGPSQINRFNRSRNVTLSADLGGYPLSDALRAIDDLASVRGLPDSVRLVESGDAEIMRDLFLGFGIALITGVLCKYCVLVLLYKNWFQPITNLSALPLCVGGALVALLLFASELNLPALIGIVMLFGVVTKNSILIIDYAFMAMREQGLSERDALLDACHKRARPVMMTTVAMVAGMLPLAVGWGGDASFRQPMAIAVIGGLLASTLLSLIVVPVISTYVSAFEQWIKSRSNSSSRRSLLAAQG